MGKRIGVRHVFVVAAIECLALLSKHYGHIKTVAKHSGNGYAAGFDGENLGNLGVCKPSLELQGNKPHHVHLNLMIEKTVNLQNITRSDLTLLKDFLF
jgi:hypothetical protein